MPLYIGIYIYLYIICHTPYINPLTLIQSFVTSPVNLSFLLPVSSGNSYSAKFILKLVFTNALEEDYVTRYVQRIC